MSRTVSLFAAFALFRTLAGVPVPLTAQDVQAPSGPPTAEEREAAENAPLFTAHETLVMTLTADFSRIKKEDRTQDSEERPGNLQWTAPDGTPHSQDIQVRTRGNFRLAKRNCDFPPLRLNLKQDESKGTVFENQDKLKLVVPCKLGQDYWEQYVLSEYLAYRMLNLLTPLSFRVRFVRVTYVDSSEKDDPFTRYGFLIEDDSDMAARNGGWKEDWAGGQLNPVVLNRAHAILVDVFQYMIGNTDWSGVEMHNMELVRWDGEPPVTVPFDFDFSGIVNARYATPDPRLSIRSVRQRLFRGFCPEAVGRQPEEYQAVYDLFSARKDEIYEMWRSQEGLEEDRVRDTLKYLDEFYDTLADPRRIRSRMISTCRSIR